MQKRAAHAISAAMVLAITSPVFAQTLDMAPPPRILSTSPQGVSIVKGAFNEIENLLSVDSEADDLNFTVSYSSNADIKSPFNILPKKWTHNWNVYVYNRVIDKSTGTNPSQYICEWYVVAGAKMLDKFQTIGCGVAGLANRYDDEYTGSDLVKVIGQNKIRYEMKDGGTIIFWVPVSGQGYRAESWIGTDGSGFNFLYDSSARLKLVTGTRGNALLFDYTTSLTKVCAIRLAVDYASAASSCPSSAINANLDPNMASVTDASGIITNFTYVSGLQAPNQSMISCVGKSLHSGCVISNTWQDANFIGVDNRISSQVLENGKQVQYSYFSARNPSPSDSTETYLANINATTSYTDEDGKAWTFNNSWDHGAPYTAKNPLLNQTSVTYDFDAKILTATQPEGDNIVMTYDTRRNVIERRRKAKAGSGLVDAVETASYPSTCTSKIICNKPTSVTDARGAVTNYVWDASHGGVLSEMGPAPVAGAARPLKLATWTQRYAWIKNSSGTLVQAATPVWVKSTETKCQTVAGSSTATCDSGASQTVTTYEYGATGTGEALLVKGVAVASGGTTLRTCYQYDSYARKIAETKPNANLSVCP